MSEMGKSETRMEIMACLFRLTFAFPHLRIMQIVGNATGVIDPYYLEDSELLNKLLEYERAIEVSDGNDSA